MRASDFHTCVLTTARHYTVQKSKSTCWEGGGAACPRDTESVLCPAPSCPHAAKGSAEFYTQGLALMKSPGTSGSAPESWAPPTGDGSMDQGSSKWELANPQSRMAALWPRVTHRMCRARGGGWDLKQVKDSKVDRETKTSRVGECYRKLRSAYLSKIQWEPYVYC